MRHACNFLGTPKSFFIDHVRVVSGVSVENQIDYQRLILNNSLFDLMNASEDVINHTIWIRFRQPSKTNQWDPFNILALLSLFSSFLVDNVPLLSVRAIPNVYSSLIFTIALSTYCFWISLEKLFSDRISIIRKFSLFSLHDWALFSHRLC